VKKNGSAQEFDEVVNWRWFQHFRSLTNVVRFRRLLPDRGKRPGWVAEPGDLASEAASPWARRCRGTPEVFHSRKVEKLSALQGLPWRPHNFRPSWTPWE
jgi:hypothetical protein